jgi:phosphatidylethanolamine/phosphatidyl-N-methylethanolamine N-methyltransferase
MDVECQAKWDRASRTYDWMTWAEERRFGPAKVALFARMTGRCLMVAAGTGTDFRYFPPGHEITAIDISSQMVEQAKRRARTYDGRLIVEVADVQELQYAGASFDSVVTSCTFCSVPDPLRGLRELYRCLKPGGQLLMFEHMRSRIGPIAILQDLMSPLTRRFGPEMNRETVSNVLRAGFDLIRERNVYMDIVRAIEATRPEEARR